MYRGWQRSQGIEPDTPKSSAAMSRSDYERLKAKVKADQAKAAPL